MGVFEKIRNTKKELERVSSKADNPLRVHPPNKVLKNLPIPWESVYKKDDENIDLKPPMVEAVEKGFND